MTENRERRQSERQTVYTAAEIVVDEGETRGALTRDISAAGLQLLTNMELEEGQEVTLRILLPGKEDEGVLVSGSVVRSEALDEDERGIWAQKVGFKFSAERPDIASAVVDLAKVHAEMYHSSSIKIVDEREVVPPAGADTEDPSAGAEDPSAGAEAPPDEAASDEPDKDEPDKDEPASDEPDKDEPDKEEAESDTTD